MVGTEGTPIGRLFAPGHHVIPRRGGSRRLQMPLILLRHLAEELNASQAVVCGVCSRVARNGKYQARARLHTNMSPHVGFVSQNMPLHGDIPWTTPDR